MAKVKFDIWARIVEIWVRVDYLILLECATWLVLMAIKVYILPRKSLKYWPLPVHDKVLAITLCIVNFIETISPLLIRLSNYEDVGKTVFIPDPDVCSDITPAEELADPKPVPYDEVLVLVDEVVDDEDEDEKVLLGIDVMVPAEL